MLPSNGYWEPKIRQLTVHRGFTHGYTEEKEHHRTRSLQSILQSPNETITSKEQKLSFAVTTNHWQDFSMERMPKTK